jgi:hypothetical protein
LALPSRGPGLPSPCGDQSGQAALLFLGVLAAVLAGTLVLFGFGQALGTPSDWPVTDDDLAVVAEFVDHRRGPVAARLRGVVA